MRSSMEMPSWEAWQGIPGMGGPVPVPVPIPIPRGWHLLGGSIPWALSSPHGEHGQAHTGSVRPPAGTCHRP